VKGGQRIGVGLGQQESLGQGREDLECMDLARPADLLGHEQVV
jgi:hypothetical protein